MRVPVRRDANGRVAEVLLDLLQAAPPSYEQRRAGVPKVVESDTLVVLRAALPDVLAEPGDPLCGSIPMMNTNNLLAQKWTPRRALLMRGCRSCFEPRHSTGTSETDSSLGSQPNRQQGILETNPPAPSTLRTKRSA